MKHRRFAAVRLLLVAIVVVAVAVLLAGTCQPPQPASTPAPGAIGTPITGTPEPTPTPVYQAPSPSPTVAPTPPPTPAPTVTPTLPPTSTAIGPSDYPSRHFTYLVGLQRQAAGLTRLSRDPLLDRIAWERSATMLRTGVFGHDIAYDLGQLRGYRYRQVGEIIAWESGIPNAPEWAIGAFMASPVHNEMILGRWTRIGSGVVSDGSRTYVTVLFGR